jgi:hypothetical protein
MAVFSPKQSARLALQLNSPPETWICDRQHSRACYTKQISASTRAPTPACAAAHSGCSRAKPPRTSLQRTLSSVAFRIGMMPESNRWTIAPTAQKSRTSSPPGIIGVPMSVIVSLCGAARAGCVAPQSALALYGQPGAQSGRRPARMPWAARSSGPVEQMENELRVSLSGFCQHTATPRSPVPWSVRLRGVL